MEKKTSDKLDTESCRSFMEKGVFGKKNVSVVRTR